MNWAKKTLVTGAGGFIGSHLSEALVKSGAQVRAFVRYNSRNDRGHVDHLSADIRNALEVFVGDLKDPAAVRNAVKGMDYVFHLGALIAIPYSYVNPMDFVQTNIVGTANILNACLEHGVQRFIHTSTSEVYGTLHYAPIDEKHPIEGKSPYAASKIGADQLALSYHRSFGLPVTIVRPFNTYGPRQSLRAIIPTIIAQALQHDEIRLGALHPTRDFNYVTDTVRGVLLAAASDPAVGEIINLGTGMETSIQALCDMVLAMVGREIRIVRETKRVRPGLSELDRLVCDYTKARQLLEWHPRVSLHEGLQQTSVWVKQHTNFHEVAKYVI
jgi:dTDP-glucose 4,6-dehydratase